MYKHGVIQVPEENTTFFIHRFWCVRMFQCGIFLFNTFASFNFPSEQYNPQLKKKKIMIFQLAKRCVAWIWSEGTKGLRKQRREKVCYPKYTPLLQIYLGDNRYTLENPKHSSGEPLFARWSQVHIYQRATSRHAINIWADLMLASDYLGVKNSIC